MSLMDLNRLAICEETQTRVALNEAVVAEYAEALEAGVKLPMVTAFFDGSTYWLADGFHRYWAHKRAKRGGINVDIRQGTKRDAVLFSTGANSTHGLRRTNDDKRRAVRTLLDDAEWSTWSDRDIAKQCDVSHTFVANLRKPELATLPPARSEEVATLPVKAGAEVGNVATEQAPEADPKSGNVATQAAANDARDDQLAESADTISELVAENEALRAQVAVGGLPTDEQQSAAEIIEGLRAEIKTLEAENQALRSSRDHYQREASELRKQINMNARELKRVRAAA